MTVFLFVFLFVLFLGMGIAFALGVPALAYLLASGQSDLLPMIPQQIYSALSSFTLLSVPFFLLAGEIMSRTGITERLVDLCNLMVGRVRGGLAYVNIMVSTIFAGISGSAIADIMALGSLEIKTMEKQGYDKAYATALTVSSSIVGPIIPPSIIMAMYSGITGVSLGAMFAAGYIPGLLFGLAQATLVFFAAGRRNFPKRTERIKPREAAKVLREGLVAVCMPVVMVGGILCGVFTPTEGAIVGVAYAIFAGFFILRTLKLSELWDMVGLTVKNSSALLMLLGIAYIFGWVLSFENVSQHVAGIIMSMTTDPRVFLLLVMACALFAGMWMEVGTIVIIIGPILYPAAIALGIHPVHFGIILILSSVMGVATPPVGVCLYAASSIAGIPAERTVKEIWPFLLAQLSMIILMIFVPDLVLFLPKTFELIR